MSEANEICGTTKAPEGWHCGRKLGHGGACAGYPLKEGTVGSSEVPDLYRLAYIPGCFRCPACDFELTKQTLSMSQGVVGTVEDDRQSEQCPNDGTWMVHVTYRERVAQFEKRCFEEIEMRQESEAALEQTKQQRDEYERKGCDLASAYGNALIKIGDLERDPMHSVIALGINPTPDGWKNSRAERAEADRDNAQKQLDGLKAAETWIEIKDGCVLPQDSATVLAEFNNGHIVTAFYLRLDGGEWFDSSAGTRMFPQTWKRLTTPAKVAKL